MNAEPARMSLFVCTHATSLSSCSLDIIIALTYLCLCIFYALDVISGKNAEAGRGGSRGQPKVPATCTHEILMLSPIDACLSRWTTMHQTEKHTHTVMSYIIDIKTRT